MQRRSIKHLQDGKLVQLGLAMGDNWRKRVAHRAEGIARPRTRILALEVLRDDFAMLRVKQHTQAHSASFWRGERMCSQRITNRVDERALAAALIADQNRQWTKLDRLPRAQLAAIIAIHTQALQARQAVLIAQGDVIEATHVAVTIPLLARRAARSALRYDLDMDADDDMPPRWHWAAPGFSPNHDYDFSWDYEMRVAGDDAIVKTLDTLWERIHTLPGVQPFAVCFSQMDGIRGYSGSCIGKYAFGTSSGPMIALDIDQIKEHTAGELEREIILTVLHELRHAEQDREDRLDGFSHSQQIEDEAEHWAHVVYDSYVLHPERARSSAPRIDLGF